MIVYLDSSVVARVYLPDESGHGEAVAMLEDPELGLITGTSTKIEVSGALVRAARAGRGDEPGLLMLLDTDLGPDGPVTVVAAPQEDIEAHALQLVRTHAIRAMDAWHLAAAKLLTAKLAEPGEEVGFATREQAQAAIAATLDLQPI